MEISALGPDLDVLPAGDLTEIGEKGINLSGGQKMRVSLARAYYLNNDMYVHYSSVEASRYILDDPLSAVDSHVSHYLFSNYIMELKRAKKTILFITHAIDYLQYCDSIVVMNKGAIEESGSYSELIHNKNGVLNELLTAQLLSKKNTVCTLLVKVIPSSPKNRLYLILHYIVHPVLLIRK